MHQNSQSQLVVIERIFRTNLNNGFSFLRKKEKYKKRQRYHSPSLVNFVALKVNDPWILESEKRLLHSLFHVVFPEISRQFQTLLSKVERFSNEILTTFYDFFSWRVILWLNLILENNSVKKWVLFYEIRTQGSKNCKYN